MARRKARKEAERLDAGRADSPKLFGSEAFGTNIYMDRMGNSGNYAQLEPWSRI